MREFKFATTFCLLFGRSKSRPCGRQKEMIGKTISHYKITEKLGNGGMGIVSNSQEKKIDLFLFYEKYYLKENNS